MKQLFFIPLCAFFFALPTLHGQNWPVAKQQFDSLYKVGYYAGSFQATVQPGRQLLSQLEHFQVFDTAGTIKVLSKLLYAFYSTGEMQLADLAGRKALLMETPNMLNYAALLIVFSEVQLHLGNIPTSDSCCQLAIRIGEKSGTSGALYVAWGQTSLGQSMIYQQKYEAAEQLNLRALKYYESLPQTDIKQGDCYNALAQIYQYQGRTSKSLEYTRKAKNAWLELPLPPALSLFQNELELGQLMISAGDYPAADSILSALTHALDQQPEDNKVRTLQYQLKLIYGQMYATLRQFKPSIQLLKEALDIEKKLYNQYNIPMVETTVNVAMVMNSQGDKAGAYQLINDAMRAIEANPPANPELMLGKLTCGLSKTTTDKNRSLQLNKAGINMLKASGMDRSDIAYVDIVLDIAKNQLDLDSADAAAETIKILGNEANLNPNAQILLCNINAIIHARKNRWGPAIQNWNAVFEKTKQAIANKLFLLNDLERIKLGEQLQEQSNLFLTQTMDPAAQDAQITATALNFQLFTKSLLLSAAQKIRLHILSDPTLAAPWTDWTDTRECLAWCYNQPKDVIEARQIRIKALENHADSLEKQLARNSSFVASESLRKSVEWTAIRNQLQPGDAAISISRFYRDRFGPTDTGCYAFFIIRHDMLIAPGVVFITDADQLDQIVLEKYLSECASPEGKGMTAALYDACWKKLAPYMQGVSRIYLSADGAFLKINFGAIQLPSGAYVADEYDIRHVFSLKDIGREDRFNRSGRSVPPTAFLAGSPDFLLKREQRAAKPNVRGLSAIPDTSKWRTLFVEPQRDFGETSGLALSPLPGTAMEVQDIALLLNKNGWKTTIVTGSDAKEEAVKALRGPTLLHLATHGYFLANIRSGPAGGARALPEANPMLRSMIFLSGAQNTLDKKTQPGEDGILTAYEAQNLQLEGTELVVLSACKTAQGKIQNGEGVYGLQRALRIAGAKSILLSLWDVDDTVGREFMNTFYEKWLSGMDKPTAFHATQLAVKKKHPQPFYWAGFVLMQ
jgi:tetratricopeptide (TPR) repeat protein